MTLKKLEQQKVQIQAKTARIKSAIRSAERKASIRRKIIIGDLIIAEARRLPQIAVLLKQKIAALDERDAAVFIDWDIDDE